MAAALGGSARARLLRRKRRRMVREWRREGIGRGTFRPASLVLFFLTAFLLLQAAFGPGGLTGGLAGGLAGSLRSLGRFCSEAASRLGEGVGIRYISEEAVWEEEGEEEPFPALREGAGFSPSDGRLFYFWVRKYREETASD